MSCDSNLLLPSLLESKGGDLFYHFYNAGGKMWIMPAKNMVTAMNLYQPSGIKGKLVKRLFPYLHRFKTACSILHAESAHYELRDDLNKLLCRLLSVECLEFSVFGGTPSVHQKITIQLSAGNRILGYCKVSDHQDVLSLFNKEAAILDTLHEKGMDAIPRCLFCGILRDGIGVFLQSTIKTNHSYVVHEWSALQERFLNDLHEKTKQSILFENTDYYRTLIELKQHLDWLPENVDSTVVEKTINRILSDCCGCDVTYSAYHADFTPWNMFVENNRLFVFDFEYTKMTYPSLLDRYHHFTQTANFEQHWTSRDIITYIKSDKGKWIDRKMYILYLLDVMSRFTMRERSKVEGDVAKSFIIWSDLLIYLTK